jgi:hypothetical protein
MPHSISIIRRRNGDMRGSFVEVEPPWSDHTKDTALFAPRAQSSSSAEPSVQQLSLIRGPDVLS